MYMGLNIKNSPTKTSCVVFLNVLVHPFRLQEDAVDNSENKISMQHIHALETECFPCVPMIARCPRHCTSVAKRRSRPFVALLGHTDTTVAK